MDGKQTKTNGLSRNSKAIILFVLLSFVFPYLLGNLIFSFHNDFLRNNWGYIVMYCPGIACLITYMFYRDQVSQLGFCLCKAKYIFWGIAIPIFYLVLSYGIYWILFPETMLSKLHFKTSFLVMIPASLFFAFGEEIGWRGFLAPAMTAKFGYVKASLLIGLIWGLWHKPLNPEVGIMFVLSTVTLTLIMNYLRLKSGSVWPAVFMHASHNYMLIDVLDSFTIGEQEEYLFGENGILTLFITALVAFVFIFINRKYPVDTMASQNAHRPTR